MGIPSEIDRVKQFVDIIESRRGGRQGVTVVLYLFLVAATVGLLDYIYHKIHPLGSALSSLLTGARFEPKIGLGDILVWAALSVGLYFFYNLVNRIINLIGGLQRVVTEQGAQLTQLTSIVAGVQDVVSKLMDRVGALEEKQQSSDNPSSG